MFSEYCRKLCHKYICSEEWFFCSLVLDKWCCVYGMEQKGLLSGIGWL